MRKISAVAVILAAFLALTACSRSVPITTKAEALVDKARWTVETFKQRRDKQMQLFRDMMTDAQGVAIFPGALKAGFIIGAEYGDGVLLSRNPDGGWSAPAFYTMGAGSIGLQIGGQVTEMILVIRSQDAVRAIVEHQGKLGADLELTVGTIGGGMEGSTTANIGADVVAFSYSAGAYAGGSVEGAVLARRNDYNQAFYGTGATPDAILFGGTFANPRADGLRQSLQLR
jgi:SH3 domain-containing YSC84-like protein 1